MTTTLPTTTRHSAKNAQRLPGELGVWMFVIGDLIAFTVIFVSYLRAKSAEPEVFLAGQAKLNLVYGGVNTMIMLASSWLVACGIEGLLRGHGRQMRRLFAGAIFCGACFAALKVVEWGEKAQHGYDLNADSFFMYYYVLTGVHLLHVLIGMSVLTFLAMRLRPGADGAQSVRMAESGGIYWHLVDALWMIIFALLYLVH